MEGEDYESEEIGPHECLLVIGGVLGALMFSGSDAVYGKIGADDHCFGGRATIIGTSGPDSIIGTPEDDVIGGLEGDGIIIGLDGDDGICGEDGNVYQ